MELQGHRAGGRRAVPALLVLLTLAASLFAGPPSWAHEGEESISAHDLVLQAIAYIANTPDAMEPVLDKVKDAQESEDTGGVKMVLVREAEEAVGRGDMVQARDLLQRSIGARADLTGTRVQRILQVSPGERTVALATGDQPGTRVVTDALAGRGTLTGADVTLLVLAGVLAAAGIMLSLRYRPAHSIHALRASNRRTGG